MGDLPDFQLEVVSAAVEATALRSGLDADKPASPAAGDIWLARDTFYLYVCFTAGSWEKVAKLYLPLAGGTMTGAIAMGTKKITGVGDPTAAQDAATKAYVDAADILRLLLTGGTMSGAIAMGTNKITGLGAPTAAGDAARKAEVDAVDAKLDDVSQAQPTRALGTIYQNTSGKLLFVTVSIYADDGEDVIVEVEDATPPTTAVAFLSNRTGAGTLYVASSMIVPPNSYYRARATAGAPALYKWTEWDLH